MTTSLRLLDLRLSGLRVFRLPVELPLEVFSRAGGPFGLVGAPSSGRSTLIEALDWALLGALAPDALHCGSRQAEVTLRVEFARQLWRLERRRSSDSREDRLFRESGSSDSLLARGEAVTPTFESLLGAPLAEVLCRRPALEGPAQAASIPAPAPPGASLERLWEEEQRALRQAALSLDADAAAHLALRLLRPREPCPVCGSPTHPAPARVGLEVEGAEQELFEARRRRQRAEAGLRPARPPNPDLGATPSQRATAFLAHLLGEARYRLDFDPRGDALLFDAALGCPRPPGSLGAGEQAALQLALALALRAHRRSRAEPVVDLLFMDFPLDSLDHETRARWLKAAEGVGLVARESRGFERFVRFESGRLSPERRGRRPQESGAGARRHPPSSPPSLYTQ